MPTATYIALANITLSSDSQVTFSSIPGNYKDLVLVFNGQIYGDSVVFQLNLDNGNNYYMVGASAADSAGVTSNTVNFNAGAVAGVRNGFRGTDRIQAVVNFIDYSSTNKHKNAISRTSSGQFQVENILSRWANTNAITSIGIYSNNITPVLKSGSTLALYGIVG